MKTKVFQYILIILILSGIAGGYFYYQSKAAQKINASKTTNLTSGLVGYWTFDGQDTTWTDATSGTMTNRGSVGGSGTFSNMSQLASPMIGKIGQSFNFDGSDDSIAIAHNDIFNITNGITMSVWIKPQSLLDYAEKSILTKGAGLDATFAMKYDNYSNCNFNSIYAFGGGGYACAVENALTINQWQHVVYVGNSSGGIIYINGINKTSTSNTMAIKTNVYDLYIGRLNSAAGYFPGQMDEVRVYNRVLTPSEITELYQQGQTKINASQVNKLTSGLVGYWPFDGNYINWGDSSTEIKDASGYNGCGGSPCHGNAVSISQATGVKIGKIGQALEFNAGIGAGDMIDLSPSTITIPNTFTISMWIYTTGGSDDYGTLITNDSDGPGIWYRGADAGANQNKLTYFYSNGDHHSSSTLSIGVWHHIVALNNTGTFNFYIDGVIDPNTYTGTPGITGLRYIGEDNASEDFKGQIDEVRIYNRVLTPSEITELYQQGQTKINASQVNKLTSGLVGYWTMDGQDINWGANTISDRSGKGYTGTLNGFSASTAPAIGISGQALKFTVNTSWINTADINEMDGTQYLSASMWVKQGSNANIRPYAAYLSKWQNNSNSFQITYGSVDDPDCDVDGVCIQINNGSSGNYGKIEHNVFQTNIWVHIAVVFDGTQSTNATKLKFYKNGVNQSLGFAGTIPSSTANISDFLTIGSSWKPDATIDEVRIYNRALSASEVTELYNMGR